MEKTGPYVYGNVAENKYVLIFFGKRTYFSCLMKNMVDLDRERWVRVASIKKDNIIWACNEENTQRPQNV